MEFRQKLQENDKKHGEAHSLMHYMALLAEGSDTSHCEQTHIK